MKIKQTHPRIATLIGLGVLAGVSTLSAFTETGATPSGYGVLQGEFQSNLMLPANLLETNGNNIRAGAGGAGGNQRVNQPIWGFELPALTAGETISEVTFSVEMAAGAVTSAATHTTVTSPMDYSLFSEFSSDDYVTSINALGNGVLVDTFDNTDVSNGAVLSFSLTGEALTQFQGLYGGDGMPLHTDVWFRPSYDGGPWDYETMANDSYNFANDGGGNVTRGLKLPRSMNQPSLRPSE